MLHFQKGILPLHVVEFPFQKLLYISEDTLSFCIRENASYIDTQSDDKEFVLLFFHTAPVLFNPWLQNC